MSAARKKNSRCAIKSGNGDAFIVILDDEKDEGLCFTLHELISKDYLGINKGTLSKSPYYWSIVSSDRGMLSGERVFRFDEDIKSVIAYSHKTFIITLYNADKQRLAWQKVPYSNFGTGLKLSYPDGIRPGGYLYRIGETFGKDDPNAVISDYSEDLDNQSYDEIVLDIESSDAGNSEDDADADSCYEQPETDNDDKGFCNYSDVRLDNAVLDGDDKRNSAANENTDEAKVEVLQNVYSGVLDDAVSHNGGYVKDSFLSLKLVLRLFIVFIIAFILFVAFLMFGKLF